MSGAELVWLASYPKSGNTWFRSILTALLNELDDTPDLNRLVGNMLVGWNGIEEAMGVKPTELGRDAILELRPAYARAWVAQAESADPLFIKTHDRLDRVRTGEWAVPPEVTRCAIYLVRNPLDVAVSYAHHSGCSPSEMVDAINDSEGEMARPLRRLGHQIPQPTGSWSDHYVSWTTDPPFPVHVVRYEDLLVDPVGEVSAAVTAAGLHFSIAQIEQAVEVTSFDRLASKEDEAGFREKAPNAERFFRRGESGAWQTELKHQDGAAIVEANRAAMTTLGYDTTDLGIADA